MGLTKESLCYDLLECMDKIDVFTERCEFTLKEREIIDKFRAGISEKYELTLQIQ